MATSAYLFDLEQFTPPPPRRRRAPLSPGIRQALARLRRTMDAIPSEEWDLRRRRWEALNRSLRSGTEVVRKPMSGGQ
jgi:hypothetical protein